MNDRVIFTISREFGSGGREIGLKISEKLGIPFYDSEIINRAAEASGLSREFIEKEEQRISGSMLFSLSSGGYMNGECRPMSDQIFIAQREAILEYASNGSCVIVGRCADYVLKDEPDCLNIFVHAEPDFKLNRIMKKYGVDKAAAEKMIKETDKRRQRHYRYYTSREWGRIDNYHICINTSKLGIDNAVEIVIGAAENIYK